MICAASDSSVVWVATLHASPCISPDELHDGGPAGVISPNYTNIDISQLHNIDILQLPLGHIGR